MAHSLAVSAAFAQSTQRLIIVVGRPDDPRVVQQHVAVKQDAPALTERNVVLQDFTPEAVRQDRPDLGVRPGVVFEVLLVGKDGAVKLRRDQPIATSEINALIDTMPMRQIEMKR